MRTQRIRIAIKVSDWMTSWGSFEDGHLELVLVPAKDGPGATLHAMIYESVEGGEEDQLSEIVLDNEAIDALRELITPEEAHEERRTGCRPCRSCEHTTRIQNPRLGERCAECGAHGIDLERSDV